MRASLRSSASGAKQWLSASINRYLRKWLILGITIGIIAGLGAVVFYLALDYTGQFLLGYLADYHIPKPKGDGGDPARGQGQGDRRQGAEGKRERKAGSPKRHDRLA